MAFLHLPIAIEHLYGTFDASHCLSMLLGRPSYFFRRPLTSPFSVQFIASLSPIQRLSITIYRLSIAL